MTLPDVNVWVAASWGGHTHHLIAKQWLDQTADTIALCRVTQMALLRLLTNQTVTGRDALTRRQAWDLMDHLMTDPRVRFLPEPEGLVPIWVTFSKRDDHAHGLWTDDYLAAFAQAANAELVTMDGGFRTRYPALRVIFLS